MIRRRQRGLSLVEILVALAISMVLLAGVVQIFVSTRQSYAVLEDFSRIQENGRFAMDYMGRIIREAGYTGCATGTIGNLTNTLNNPDQFEYNFTEAIRGYEYAATGPGATYTMPDGFPAACGAGCDTSKWTTRTAAGAIENIPAGLAQHVVPGSDVVGIRLALGGGVPLVSPYNNSAQLFAADMPALNTGTCPAPFETETMYSGLCEGDILVATDCNKARVFQATNLTTTGGSLNAVHSNASSTDCPDTNGKGNDSYCPGNAISSWGGSSAPDEERFNEGSSILKMVTVAFFLGQGENGAPALFRRINESPPEEMVENVESLQILYGVDTSGNGDANRYRPADQVDDFADVVSLRLSLLVRGADEVAPVADPGGYGLSGTVVNPASDRRLRRWFTGVIKLRNRGLQRS